MTRLVFLKRPEKTFGLLSAIQGFFTRLEEALADHWDRFLRRMEYLFIVYLWASVGILLMALGLFDLLIDFGGLPRGIVFSIGGLLIFLVAVIFLQAAKIKKRGKSHGN